ncbi:hypothetical protein C7974DRAFT_405716 [Boeremia exigua]|uniref:uncharacterized protein n=1 Tax=Boeremia exigua TaxID=749465 RepID=UPI001E8E4E62|nr:uncharacterized protein C7974DRAFT_405716 [Boeremia exigua]KAH6612500.1 hypothetical protein C7974DRAFT_405716 [Boeremia exigua]
MRFSVIAAVATFSATVLGQGLVGQIPQCAQSCFGTDNLGTCNLIDVACICGSSAITQVACCVLSSCNQADIDTTINFASTLCRGAGVTLNTSPDCAAANSSSSASSSASASASAAASSSAASGSASVTAITGTNTASGSATGSATRSASGSASGSPAATAATGAGAFQTAGPILGFGVAVVGMLAAL